MDRRDPKSRLERTIYLDQRIEQSDLPGYVAIPDGCGWLQPVVSADLVLQRRKIQFRVWALRERIRAVWKWQF
jgi:hypothetical protein